MHSICTYTLKDFKIVLKYESNNKILRYLNSNINSFNFSKT